MWDNIIIKEVEEVIDTDYKLYMKRSKIQLNNDRLDLALKEIDKACKYAKEENEKKEAIIEKESILRNVYDKTVELIISNRVIDALNNFNLYINYDLYINKNIYNIKKSNILSKVLKSDSLYSLRSEDLDKVFFFITRNFEKIENIILINDYILNYIKFKSNNSENLRDSLISIEIARKYYTNPKSFVIYKCILNLGLIYNDISIIVSVLKIQVEELVKNYEGKYILDLCCSKILTNGCTKDIDNLKNIFISRFIPDNFVCGKFQEEFNLLKISNMFENAVDKELWMKAREYFNCIKHYFEIYNLDKKTFLKFCIYNDLIDLIFNYLDYNIENYRRRNYLIDKIELLYRFKGISVAENFIEEMFKKLYMQKNINDLLLLINDILNLNTEHGMPLKNEYELSILLNDYFLLSYVYPKFKETKKINDLTILEVIKNNVENLKEDNLVEAYKELRHYYNYTKEDFFCIAQYAYDKCEFKKSIFILNLIRETTNKSLKLQIYNLQIKNYLQLNDKNMVLEAYEEILMVMIPEVNFKLFNQYYNKIIEWKEYSRAIKCLNFILDKNSKITINDRCKLNRLLSIFYLKRFKLIKALLSKIKSTMIGRIYYIVKANKAKIIVALIGLVIIILGVYQYIMFSTGMWMPISHTFDSNISHTELFVGESAIISMEEQVFPKYTKIKGERVKLDNNLIAKIDGNKLVALSEGEVNINFMIGDKVADSINVVVIEPGVESFKVNSTNDLVEVGQKTNLTFEYKYKGNKLVSVVPEIESSNPNVIRVNNNQLIALNEGDVDIIIKVGKLIKKLSYSIKEPTLNMLSMEEAFKIIEYEFAGNGAYGFSARMNGAEKVSFNSGWFWKFEYISHSTQVVQGYILVDIYTGNYMYLPI